jgi:hypothetical protein
MGNRAIITTPDREVGVYLHWNGDCETVETILAYCELHAFRPPNCDGYGWARLCQVVCNFIGGATGVEVGRYEQLPSPDDNGVYITENWKIVDHIKGPNHLEDYGNPASLELLRKLDLVMPSRERLGVYVESVEIPTSDLKRGDKVWLRWIEDRPPQLCTVERYTNKFSNPNEPEGLPCARIRDFKCSDGYLVDHSHVIHEETCRVPPSGGDSYVHHATW